LRFFCRRRFIDPIDIDRDLQLFVFVGQYALRFSIEVDTLSVDSTPVQHHASKSFRVECPQGAVFLAVIGRVIVVSLPLYSMLLFSRGSNIGSLQITDPVASTSHVTALR